MPAPLAGLVAVLLPAIAVAQEVIPLAYDELARIMAGRAEFETLPRRAEPGFALDHVFGEGRLRLGERFEGQRVIGAPADRIEGAPAAPLRLRPGTAGRNLSVAFHRGFGSNALFPLGPAGFPAREGRGEGAVAILFDEDQPGVGLRVHSDYPDPLGLRPPPGTVILTLYARDGRRIATRELRLDTGITEIGLLRVDGLADIAGVTLTNTDPGGIALDGILFQLGQAISQGEGRMPKGYWVAHVDVSDPQVYEDYKAANAAPFAEYGAKFLVRGGEQEVREGQARKRTVVLEFPSYEAAIACYESEGYQKAKAIREAVSQGDMVIVQGYDG